MSHLISKYIVKPWLMILICTFTLISCNHEKKTIQFKKIANFDPGNISKNTATLNGVAVFMNLTDDTFHLKDLMLDLLIDGKNIGTVVMKSKKEILPRAEFSVPISYTYETKSFIEEGKDPAKSYGVELSGDLTVKNENEEMSIPVKFTTTFEFQTRKEKRIERREERREERRAKKNAR